VSLRLDFFVSAALRPAALRFLVTAAFFPAALRFLVSAAFFPAARCFFVKAAFFPAAFRLRVCAAFFAASLGPNWSFSITLSLHHTLSLGATSGRAPSSITRGLKTR